MKKEFNFCQFFKFPKFLMNARFESLGAVTTNKLMHFLPIFYRGRDNFSIVQWVLQFPSGSGEKLYESPGTGKPTKKSFRWAHPAVEKPLSSGCYSAFMMPTMEPFCSEAMTFGSSCENRYEKASV